MPILTYLGNLDMGGGIGLAVDAGIGLAVLGTVAPSIPPPVDFIFSDSYMIGGVQMDRSRQMLHSRLREQKNANAEMQEMMQLYSRWRKAA